MIRDERFLLYRIRESATGNVLTVFHRVAYTEREETIVEGLVFDSVPAVLHFVGVHFPNAHEVFDDAV